jgi:Uma2 family endonuclease
MGIPHYQTSISVEEYLTGELLSEVRHEYMDGEVFAMAGGTLRHNTLSLNIASELRAHFKNKKGGCRVFMADVKARILAHKKHIFYYPDVMVSCDDRDANEQYLRFPKLIIEVLSDSTARLDKQEKFANYRTIPTLEEYVLVEQQRAAVTIYRRSKEWQGELITELDAMVHLESVGLALSLSAFYDDVSI